MQIPNAKENDIVQDLYCVCLMMKEFINLTKNACKRTYFKINCDGHFTIRFIPKKASVAPIYLCSMLQFIFNPVLIYLRVCFLGIGNGWLKFAHDALVLPTLLQATVISEGYNSRSSKGPALSVTCLGLFWTA